MSAKTALWSGLAALLFFCSCSHYSTSSGLVGGIRSAAVPIAGNDTPEAGIAERLTERLTDAFSEDGRLRIVDEESADAVLLLRVVQREDAPFTYTAGEQTEQYRFRLLVDASLNRIEDDKNLLEFDDVVGWGTYEAEDDIEGRDQAVDAALDMVIEEVLDRTTASW